MNLCVTILLVGIVAIYAHPEEHWGGAGAQSDQVQGGKKQSLNLDGQTEEKQNFELEDGLMAKWEPGGTCSFRQRNNLKILCFAEIFIHLFVYLSIYLIKLLSDIKSRSWAAPTLDWGFQCMGIWQSCKDTRCCPGYGNWIIYVALKCHVIDKWCVPLSSAVAS